MVVAVGLGNPGKDYEATRHNLGFHVVERLADLYGITTWENKFDALYARGWSEGNRFMLAKPQTYMNNSGRAVQALMHYYKIPLEELLVIVDDLDLEIGKIRLRTTGSDGGHRGLRSIIQSLGSSGFNRIRIGIGRPPAGESVLSRVLKKSSHPDEQEKLKEAVEEAARISSVYINTGHFENWSST